MIDMLAIFGIDDAAFWTYVITSVVIMSITFAISQLTQKDPKPPSVQPDEYEMPTQREGTVYPIGFGTNWFEAPVIDWWGDLSTSPIVRHMSVNKWFNNKRVYYTVGYHYSVGMNLLIAQGVYDGVKQIKIGGTVAWPNPDDKTQWNADAAASAAIDEPNLLGGEDKEGGVVGTVRFCYGGSAQTVNAYLSAQLGSNISAYRGWTSAVFEGVRMGTSPYLKTPSFLLKRTDVLTDGSSQWYSAKADINNNLNAAHIIRECLTNADWGMNISAALLPEATWQAVADSLYTENFGLSLKWEGQNQTLKKFVQDVLRHIDAKLYEEPTTGEIILKLIRDDYVLGSLDEYDDSDVLDIKEFGRGTVYEAINTIQMTYWNTIDNKPVSIPDHNIALIDMQNGKWVEHSTEYIGITSDALAGTIIARDRQQLGSFPVPLEIEAKRTMAALRPGDVFKLTWPPMGITSMVVRVLRINLGTLRNNIVKLDCIQDVFSVQTALYSPPPTSGWTDPRNAPADVTYYKLMEATFWDILLDAGISDALALDDDSGFLMAVAKATSGDAYDYKLHLRDSPTSDFNLDGTGHFTPNGTLDALMPKNATDVTITMSDVEGLADVQVGDRCLIENEICKVLSVTVASNQVQIERGVLDTVPEQHASSTRVWFIGTISYICGTEYTATNQPGVKFLPRTPLGELAIGSATAHNASAMDSRMVRPYPPGNFKIDGSSYPASFSGQPTITWNHRDRTVQISEIISHDSSADYGPEAGTTYTLKIYDEDNNLVRTETGLTGKTYTYAELDERTDCGLNSGDPLNTQLRFVLYSVRDGYDSWQSYDLTVSRV
jgi:hypothetical protein